MGRQLELTFPRSGTRAIADMLDQEAPRTCQAIWDVLAEPVERLVIHAASSGQNVLFYNLPPVANPHALPLENHTVRPGPGDLLFFYMPAGRLAGLDVIREWLPPSGEVHEITFSYGHSDQTGSAINGWRGSLFARIVDNLEGFAAACHRMRTEGAQNIVLRRLIAT